MQIENLKCNHITTPLGFKMDHIVLSWITYADKAEHQTAARIVVATDIAFTDVIFDSQRREDMGCFQYELSMSIAPRTRYYWKVAVWSDVEYAESETSWFESAKKNEPWTACWIAPQNNDNPVFRKKFQLPQDKKIVSARAYATAAGVYELGVNDAQVSDERLSPLWNQYTYWLQYQTYDITNLLVPGNNTVEAIVGEGWFRGRFGLRGGQRNMYGDQPGFLCEIIVTYADGTEQIIGTDTSWQTAPCFITESSIYDGETQNPALLTEYLSEEDWMHVVKLEMDMALLSERLSLPVLVKQTLLPKEVIITPTGETVLDMGQNMVGGFILDISLPKGTELILQFGEVLQNGNFYRENLRTAKQKFVYHSDGKQRTIRPHFTYFGYRYVKVEGWNGTPATLQKNFYGTVWYSDMMEIGQIHTSNQKVNQLISNVLWGQKGNFLDVPTDCPQRDERMGWTGDAQVFCATASFNMDTYAFYRKYLYDMRKEQEANEGKVPLVVPNVLGQNTQSSAWADATTIIPWTCYLFTGDITILKEHFPAMKAYVQSIRREDVHSRHLWTPSFSFGDWLAQDGLTAYSYFGGTSTDLISTAYYYYSARLVSKSAHVLGYHEDAADYAELADQIRQAFQKEFITDAGRLAVETQTAAVLTLFMDLAKPEHEARIAEDLHYKLQSNNYYLKTGFVGTPYICRVLSAHGYNETAYRLLLNEEHPSWLYAVNLGATTIWERWNSLLPDGKVGELGMNSFNHYAYGSIVEWMYRDMCGFNPVESSPGFQKVRMEPKPDGRLQYASMVYHSPIGKYQLCWEILGNGNVIVNVLIPFNGEAELVLPHSDQLPKRLTRGSYSFTYKPNTPFTHHLSSKESTIKELQSYPAAWVIVRKYIPDIDQHLSRNSMAESKLAPLHRLLGSGMLYIDPDKMDQMDKELHTIKVDFKSRP